MSTKSIWKALTSEPTLPRENAHGVHVDVAVVGGGITGITCALLLKDADRAVAVLEARTLGNGVTAGSSGHITQVLDTRYYEIEENFGAEGARLVAESSAEAIDQIAALVLRTEADCDFARVPGYLYTERGQDVDKIHRELEAAVRAGVVAEPFEIPLPIPTRAGLRFPNQAQFNPLAYVLALGRLLARGGGHVFEGARVVAVDEGEPCRLHLEHGSVLTADRVILATHVPLNRVLLTPRVAQYRSYVLSGPAHESVPGLFWDTDDPYHYVRRHRVGARYHWIVGGADHKTGQTLESRHPFEELGEFARRVGLTDVEERWSAQVVEPVDGLPLIGPNAMSERVYVATGFSGNGLTFGTLAAMLLRDACLDKPNRYAGLYSATRVEVVAALRTFIGENVDFPLHILSDALLPPDVESLSLIKRGEGKSIRLDGQRLAVHRDNVDELHAVSPVCTHLGCHVKFNPAETTWDCPCHGSRFGIDGRVLDGPAVKNLAYEKIDEAPPSSPRERHPVIDVGPEPSMAVTRTAE